VEALLDAADEDLGTGGPDPIRGIYPSIKTITRSGYADVTDDEVRRVVEQMIAERAKTLNGG
jgi:proteasome beta subunit